MTKLNTVHPLVLSPAPGAESEPARRLIFLLPNSEEDPVDATRRVWELATAAGARVKLIGLCDDAAEEPGLRRRLVTMSAIMNQGGVSVETEIAFGRDWVEAVKSRWQAGDTVLCTAEQRAGMFQKPLSEVLQSNLDVPLYILGGLYPQDTLRPNWATGIAAWTGSIAIILGFLLLQVRFIPLANDWTIALELLSTAVEFWLIWVWNGLLG